MDFFIKDNKIKSPGLEFQVSTTCNLRCKGCSQNSPYLVPAIPSISEFEHYINILSKYYIADRFTILGGEPLLNSNIVNYLLIARSSGISSKICLTTNGTLLNNTTEVVWELLDKLEISMYPTTRKLILNLLPRFEKLASTYNVELNLLDIHSFKQISITEMHKGQSVVNKIFDNCYYKKFCNTIKGNKLFRCGVIVNLDEFLSKMEIITDYSDRDGCLIEDNPIFQDKLLRYINNISPMEGCSYCLGCSGTSFKHKMLSKHEIKKLM